MKRLSIVLPAAAVPNRRHRAHEHQRQRQTPGTTLQLDKACAHLSLHEERRV